MNSNPAVSGKTLPPSHAAVPQAGPATASVEIRRPSQSPLQAQPQAVPRKGQTSRKQHRNHRKATGIDNRRLHSADFDEPVEMNAKRHPAGRRGQTSITHIFNYRVPGTIGYDQYTRAYRRHHGGGSSSSSSYHHDKQRYVRANYRFVVSPEGIYQDQAADADANIVWENVLQVIASSQSQAASCPICLLDPVAPRMAKCGHIFCLSCLIRFMNAADDDKPAHSKGPQWKKCPICDDAVYLKDVRPVRFYSGQESPLPQVGDDVVLRLMARKAASTLALPREGGAEALNAGDDIPWYFEANVMDYGRVMKGTGAYMAEQYDEEIESLLRQEKEDELLYGEEGEWTQRAIKSIRAAKERVENLGKDDAVAPPTHSLSSAKHKARQSGPDFFFYSAPPHLYLSPLDIRILKTKFGDFSMFPSTLLPKVEHISTGHVVDDALRKRAKYLGHLPRGCLVSFLECDWTDIVPADILEQFGSEIERRRKRNFDKEAQEERERLEAERLEVAAMRGSMVRRFDPVVDEELAPKVDMNDFLPLGATATTPPEPRHGFQQLADLSTSPSTSKTVWGTPAVHVSPTLEPVAPRRPVNDGWLNVEEIPGDDGISAQMEALGVETSDTVPAKGQGQKKKKKQKITLMSTGSRRGN